MVWLKIRINDIKTQGYDKDGDVVVWLKIRINDIWKIGKQQLEHVVVWLKIRINDILIVIILKRIAGCGLIKD